MHCVCDGPSEKALLLGTTSSTGGGGGGGGGAYGTYYDWTYMQLHHETTGFRALVCGGKLARNSILCSVRNYLWIITVRQLHGTRE